MKNKCLRRLWTSLMDISTSSTFTLTLVPAEWFVMFSHKHHDRELLPFEQYSWYVNLWTLYYLCSKCILPGSYQSEENSSVRSETVSMWSFCIWESPPVARTVCSCYNYAQSVGGFVTEECSRLRVPKRLLTVSVFLLCILKWLYFMTECSPALCTGCIMKQYSFSCRAVPLLVVTQIIFAKCIVLVFCFCFFPCEDWWPKISRSCCMIVMLL